MKVEEPVELQGERKVIDIAISGDDLVVAEEYMGSRTYKEQEGSYVHNQTLTHSKFLTSLDTEDSLQLLVQASYNRTAYVYQDSGSGFTWVQSISTSSQVMAVDLDEDRLLLGHRNGDISEYFWQSSEFVLEKNFPAQGTSIYGVKSCPDSAIVALKETAGRFHLLHIDQSGTEHSLELDELAGVKWAVAHDCKRVFISNNMLMNVQVFTLQEGSYSLSSTVQEDFPLWDIAINPEADIFVVNRHTDQSTVVYMLDGLTNKYKLMETLPGQHDHYAAVMTDSRIVLGDLHGKLSIYKYSHSVSAFARKHVQEYIDRGALVDTTWRAITDIDISDRLVVATNQYRGLLFFQIPDSEPVSAATVASFSDSIFISSVSISSSIKTFVAGTSVKTVLVYVDSGSGYELNQTI